MLGSKMMGVLTPSVPVEASRVVPLLFPLRADPIPQGECTSLEAELVRAMEADAGWTWLATALNPTGALWRRQQLFLRLATPTYAARLFESARGARVDSDVLLVLEQFSLVRASLCGLLGGPGKPSEWEAARRLRQLPPVGEFWNGRVPWDVVRVLELAGHVDTSDVLVAHCVVDDGVATVSMAKELIHRDRFHTLALLVKHNPPEGRDRGLILEALMDRVPDRVDVSRVVFKDNATYEVIKEQCLAQKLEALAALWYQRDASRHLNWHLSLDFATSYIDHEDHAVRRRAFHASSNVCLQSVDAANYAIFERDLLRHVFTHLVRFRDIHHKTTSEQRETVALKHPLQCALHALVHVDKSRSLPFKSTVEPLLNAVIECLERRLFPSVHKLLITIASILALDLSNDKALRGRLQKAARSVSASILTESIAVLARADDAHTVLHFLCNIFIELKDVSPALEARTLSLCRDVSSRRSEQVWTSFPELCAHISGRLEDYRRDAKALDMGVSLTCVLLGMQPGCELLRVIVERVLCELEDEQYEPTDELLARVCFDAILSMASTVPASEFLVGDNAGGVVAEASDESSESDADSIRASEQQVYDLLNCRLEALFAVLHRQERVKQVGYSWPSAEEVDRAGYLEVGGSNPSDEDDSADGDSADGDEPQRYQAQSGGLSFDEAVEELLSRAFPDGRPPGNIWLHVAPWDYACDLAYSGANVLAIPLIGSNDFSAERAVYFWPGCSSCQASKHAEFADARNANQVSRSMFVLLLVSPFLSSDSPVRTMKSQRAMTNQRRATRAKPRIQRGKTENWTRPSKSTFVKAARTRSMPNIAAGHPSSAVL